MLDEYGKQITVKQRKLFILKFLIGFLFTKMLKERPKDFLPRRSIPFSMILPTRTEIERAIVLYTLSLDFWEKERMLYSLMVGFTLEEASDFYSKNNIGIQDV